MNIYGQATGEGGSDLDSGGTIGGNLEIVGDLTVDDIACVNLDVSGTATIGVLESELKIEDPIITLAVGNPADLVTTGISEEYKDGAVTKYGGILRDPATGNQYVYNGATPHPTGSTPPSSLARTNMFARNFNSEVGLTLGSPGLWQVKLNGDNFEIKDGGGRTHMFCIQNGLTIFDQNVKFRGDNIIIGNSIAADNPRILFETALNAPAFQLVVEDPNGGDSKMRFEDEGNIPICIMDHTGTQRDLLINDDCLVGGIDAVVPCAQLEVRGEKGLLNPRMTAAQRDAIPSKLAGLQVWNSDAAELEVWDGSAWISGSGPGGHNSIQEAYDVGATMVQTAAKPLAITGANSIDPAFTIVEPGAGANGPGFSVTPFGNVNAATLTQSEYGTGLSAVQRFKRARGTPAAPAAVQVGDDLGLVTFEGFNGAAFQVGAQIECNAVEAFTGAQAGSELIFKAVPVGIGATVAVAGLTVGQSETGGVPDTRVLGDLVLEKRIVSAGTHLDLDVARVGDPGAISSSTALEVSSTVAGFLPPRLSTAQRDALTAPPSGLMIFNTTTDRIEYRGPGSWESTGRFVEGPIAGAQDNAIAVYDGVSGSLVRDSSTSIDSLGRLKTVTGFPFAGRPWVTIYSLTTTTSVGLTTVETNIFDAGAPLPVNGFNEGTMLRWCISGAKSNSAGDTCTIRIYMYDNFIQLDSGNIAGGALDEFEYRGTVRIGGGSSPPTAYSSIGQQRYTHAQTASNIKDYMATLTPGTFDVTAPGANFRATAQWNDAAANVVFFRNFTIEMCEGQ